MKPEVDQILGLSASQLMGTLAPLLPTGYAQGSAQILGIMMMLAAQEYDRAADIRATENDAMRVLFRESAALVGDAGLADALREAAATRDESLRISVLDGENAKLRRLLIRLQIHAEEHAMGTIERKVWDVLKASARRRLLRLA